MLPSGCAFADVPQLPGVRGSRQSQLGCVANPEIRGFSGFSPFPWIAETVRGLLYPREGRSVAAKPAREPRSLCGWKWHPRRCTPSFPNFQPPALNRRRESGPKGRVRMERDRLQRVSWAFWGVGKRELIFASNFNSRNFEGGVASPGACIGIVAA